MRGFYICTCVLGHHRFEPTCFLNEEIVNTYAKEFMFLSCIAYINQVKKGPFAEHSNQLWSISGVSSWQKINDGLIRMYKVEVSLIMFAELIILIIKNRKALLNI